MSPQGSQNDAKRNRANDDPDTTSKRPCVSQSTSETEEGAESDAWCEEQADNNKRTLENVRVLREYSIKMRRESERLKAQNDMLEEKNKSLTEQLLEALVQNKNMSNHLNTICKSMDQFTQQVTNQRACNWKLSLE